jgi:hypothetical protein
LIQQLYITGTQADLARCQESLDQHTSIMITGATPSEEVIA